MNSITITGIEAQNLDTTTIRGTARLCDLTRISQVDVFDQDTNPNGLQRDLNKRHSLEAYDYATRPARKKAPRAFPEVFLNVRDKKFVEIERVSPQKSGVTLATLTFDLDKLDKARTVKVSRVDGNHRLFFGNGDGKERGPVDSLVPFSITVGLDRDEESSLFVDVNAEQKGLNTSHLSILRERMTPDEIAYENNPARFLAYRLVQDVDSPWHGTVHLGGSKIGAKSKKVKRPVNFVALSGGVARLLRSTYLQEITDVDTKYAIIRNYYQAVRFAAPGAWDSNSNLLILKNLGVNVMSQFGIGVIDRSILALPEGETVPSAEDMAGLVQHGLSQVNFERDSSDVAGMNGNRAVLLIAGRMSEGLPKSGEGLFDPEKALYTPEPEPVEDEGGDAPAVDTDETPDDPALLEGDNPTETDVANAAAEVEPLSDDEIADLVAQESSN